MNGHPLSFAKGATVTSVRESSIERVRSRRTGTVIVSWLTTTDHKVIGYLYLITSFVFFLAAGSWR